MAGFAMRNQGLHKPSGMHTGRRSLLHRLRRPLARQNDRHKSASGNAVNAPGAGRPLDEVMDVFFAVYPHPEGYWASVLRIGPDSEINTSYSLDNLMTYSIGKMRDWARLYG